MVSIVTSDGSVGTESKEIEIDGKRFHYYDGGSGPLTFLMVHGNGASADTFEDLTRSLSVSHRCVSLDLLGFGRSDKPSDPSYYTLPSVIKDVVDFVIGLDLQDVVFVGHELGGLIVSAAAIQEPHRYRGGVLINAPARPIEKLPLRLRALRGSTGKIVEKYQNLIYSKGYRGYARSRESLYRSYYSEPTEGVAMAFFLRMISTSRDHENYSLTLRILSKLESWDIPTLLVYGEKSFLFNSERGRELHRKMARARYLEVEEGSYFVHEEHSEEVLRAIEDWLEVV